MFFYLSVWFVFFCKKGSFPAKAVVKTAYFIGKMKMITGNGKYAFCGKYCVILGLSQTHLNTILTKKLFIHLFSKKVTKICYNFGEIQIIRAFKSTAPHEPPPPPPKKTPFIFSHCTVTIFILTYSLYTQIMQILNLIVKYLQNVVSF